MSLHDPASTDTIDEERCRLWKSQRLTMPINEKYTLVSTEAVTRYSVELGDSVGTERVFSLMVGGEILGEVTHSETSLTDTHALDYEYKYELFDGVRDIIERIEGEEATIAIGKLFVNDPKDIPPWERTIPVRQTDMVRLKEGNYTLNDEGNAHRFQEECQGYLVYDADSCEWKAWVVNHWEPADTRLVLSERFVATSLAVEFDPAEVQLKTMEATCTDEQAVKNFKAKVKEMRSHINYSKRQPSMRAMASICAQSTMAVHMKDAADTSLLACKNGIFDTRKGIFYPNTRADMLKDRYPTHYIECTYIPNAKPAKFLSHLHKIFQDNTTEGLTDEDRKIREESSFSCFSRLLGYLMVAGNPEQIIIFLWGDGSNGKSTTTDVIRFVFGNELAEANAKELYSTNEDKHTSGIAKGLSSRILLFVEMSDDDSDNPLAGKVSRETVKKLTGEKRTSSFRSIYKAGELQEILCSPIAPTNELPHFDKELDDALLRRIVTVPHDHIFTEEEKDKNIYYTLIEEKDEIFSYIMDQMIEYCHHGLIERPKHWITSQALLLAGDSMYTYISETYQKTNESTGAKMPFDDIANRYIAWCRPNGIDCKTKFKPIYLHEGDLYTTDVEKLTNPEAGRLHKAFKAMGYTEKLVHGRSCICCEFKHS